MTVNYHTAKPWEGDKGSFHQVTQKLLAHPEHNDATGIFGSGVKEYPVVKDIPDMAKELPCGKRPNQPSSNYD